MSLAQKSRALAEAVIFDDCGVNGRGGNGGLLSRRTIAAADAVLKALAQHPWADISVRRVAGGSVADIIITAPEGSGLELFARDTALLMSLLMQYGCGLRHIAEALTKNADGGPEGLAGLAAAQLLAMRE